MEVVTKLDIVIATLEIMGGSILCTLLINLAAYWIADLIIGLG